MKYLTYIMIFIFGLLGSYESYAEIEVTAATLQNHFGKVVSVSIVSNPPSKTPVLDVVQRLFENASSIYGSEIKPHPYTNARYGGDFVILKTNVIQYLKREYLSAFLSSQYNFVNYELLIKYSVDNNKNRYENNGVSLTFYGEVAIELMSLAGNASIEGLFCQKSVELMSNNCTLNLYQ